MCLEALVLCLNTVVVLMDRLLWIDPAHVKFSSGYEYFKTLNPNSKSNDNGDFAQLHPDGQLIWNQSFVFAWIPFSKRKMISEDGKTSSCSSQGLHTSKGSDSNADGPRNDLNSDDSLNFADANSSNLEGSASMTKVKRRLGRPKRGDSKSLEGSSDGDRVVTRGGQEGVGEVEVSEGDTSGKEDSESRGASPDDTVLMEVRFKELDRGENAPPIEGLVMYDEPL